MSEIENSYTIESLWAIATHFTLEEGGVWMEKIPNQAFGTADFHALKFNPTCEWDVLNGFRTFEYPGDRDDDSKSDSIPIHPDARHSWPLRGSLHGQLVDQVYAGESSDAADGSNGETGTVVIRDE